MPRPKQKMPLLRSFKKKMKSQTDTKPWVRTGFSCNLGSGFNYTAEVNYSQRMGTNFKFGI